MNTTLQTLALLALPVALAGCGASERQACDLYWAAKAERAAEEYRGTTHLDGDRGWEIYQQAARNENVEFARVRAETGVDPEVCPPYWDGRQITDLIGGGMRTYREPNAD